MADLTIRPRWPVDGTTPEHGHVHAPGDGEQESVLRIGLTFLALVKRNARLVILFTAGAVGVAVLQMRDEKPMYRASAVVRLTDKGRVLSGGLAGDPASRMLNTGNDAVLSQVQVLQSRAVAAEVVTRQGLRLEIVTRNVPSDWMDAVRVAPDAPNGPLTVAMSGRMATVRYADSARTVPVGGTVEVRGVRFTIAQRPPVDAVEMRIVPAEAAIGAVTGALRGRPREHTDIVDIFYTANDARIAQNVANSAAAAFQDLSARTDRQASQRRRQFIEGQLEKVELKFAEAQLAHNAFRSRTQVYSTQDKFKAQQSDLFGLTLRRQELQSDRKLLLSVLDVLQRPTPDQLSGERMSALMSAPGVNSNPVIAQLYGKLVEFQTQREGMTTGSWSSASQNPDVRRLDTLIVTTQGKLIAAVRGQISTLDSRLAAVDDLKGNAATAMAALPNVEAEETRLLMRVDTYKHEADLLREELQRAQIEEAAEAGQVDIVDLATLPRVPIGTGRAPRIVFALTAGFALGTLLAYVLENYTSVIRRREEVERIAMVPMLAVVPPLVTDDTRSIRLLAWMHPSRNENGKAGGNGHAVVHRRELATLVDTNSQAAEAFRTLRTNLLFSPAIQSVRQVIVTSAGPAEGKSTIAANLAVAFAQQGQRVLLLDCDLRRPRIHQVFGHAQIPGLTNVLAGNMSSAEVIHTTNIDGLSILTAGPTPPNPAELLGGPRMRDLLERLAQSYEMVIIDSPPVLIASDAAILSRHVAGTLLVVRAGKTQAAAVRDAMQHLATVGTHVAGTVLNDPDGEVAKFSSYYGHYYQDYYGATQTTT